MNKILKYILIGIGLLLLGGAGFVYYQYQNTRSFLFPDYSDPDYLSRIIPLEAKAIARRLTDAEMPAAAKAMQSLMGDLPEDLPYMVDYHLAGEKGQTKPAIVIAPGGGFMMRAENHEGIEIAQWLNSIGISAFILNYRVAPDLYPAALYDAQLAMTHLRNHADEYQIDPQRIGMLGFSAGGHLTSLLGTQNPSDSDSATYWRSRPDLMVLCYPATDFTADTSSGIAQNAREAVISLVGPRPTPEILRTVSTFLHVDSLTPASFIWTTKTDELVPYEHSEVFAAALKTADVGHELHIFPSGRHGLGLAKEGNEPAEAWADLCEKWLRAQGF
ncbi:MAG: alpha/beta hydrolase [Bacteroidota bacterium]